MSFQTSQIFGLPAGAEWTRKFGASFTLMDQDGISLHKETGFVTRRHCFLFVLGIVATAVVFMEFAFFSLGGRHGLACV